SDWVMATPITDTIEYRRASAPRPPVTRSKTAAGDILTTSEDTRSCLSSHSPLGSRLRVREDGAMPQDAVDALVKLLDLEPIEVNIFRGVSPDEDRQRVFGGQVA